MSIVNDLDHVNITTTSLKQSVEFYTMLGLRDGYRPQFSFDGAWMYCGDRAVVHLQCPKTNPYAGVPEDDSQDPLEADPTSLILEEPGWSSNLHETGGGPVKIVGGENEYAAAIGSIETSDWFNDGYSAAKRDNREKPTVDHIAFRCPGVDIDDVKIQFETANIKYTYNNIPHSTLEQLFVIDPNNVRVELNFDERTDKER